MFSDLILRNSRRSRKENGLFFSSLVVSIVAFYIILSISNQDVMIFLKKMESDAVNKLMLLIPVFYVMTLVILLFLIYFASNYQLQRRRHEFGVYLMMGMRRSKLFSMLLAEDFVSSVFALAIGLPVAVLLSEIISLTTAKMVGMGIIGHKFTLSLPAVLFTVIGFLTIKLLAFLILSGTISRQEIGTLLSDTPDSIKKQKPAFVYGIAGVCGIVMLVTAYAMAICGLAWQEDKLMLITMLLGMIGTILLFYGMRVLIAAVVKNSKGNKKLHVFNFRQIQENVIRQSTSIAISSLLILAALCFFGAGIGISGTSSLKRDHVLDYTFRDYSDIAPHEVLPKIQKVIKENGLENHFSQLLSMGIGQIRTTDEYEDVFTMDTVIDTIEQQPKSQTKEIILDNLSYTDRPYLIRLSDYNKLLELAGRQKVELRENEAAVYMDPQYTNGEQTALLNKILADHPQASLDGSTIYLTGEVQSTKLVTDRSITLSFALILPDEQFSYYTQDKYSVYINGVLNKETVGKIGLMNAISAMNVHLDALNLSELHLEYESFLQNMGRQLFFSVAASYITSYLAIIFLVVSNTILGVQFLMSQRRTGRRYRTLVRLGASYETLCRSARKQINWFMGLPVFVAAVGSLFGVKALYAGILSVEIRNMQGKMLVVSGATILLLLVVEYIYMTVVKRSSDKYLLTLIEPQREE